jgi:hypothetical protein
MRLIVVPLSSKACMVYCQKTVLPSARTRPRIDDKVAERAAKIWDDWSRSESKLKKNIVSWANIAMERISYEEWGLKTIPARTAVLRRRSSTYSKGQQIHFDNMHISAEEFEKYKLSSDALERIPVLYPSTALSSSEVIGRLSRLANRGVTHHTKYFWLSAIGAPLTLPIAILPVIPNLPGFYLLFRAWSNWKALEGGKHLSYLLKDDHLSYHTNTELDELFAQLMNDEKRNPKEVDADDKLLLDEDNIDTLVRIVGAKEMAPELHRAVRQIKRKMAQK